MDILTIFDDSELRRAVVYPLQSSLIHVWTPVGKVGTIVGILILVLLIYAKFKSRRILRNQQIGCLMKVIGKKLLSCMYCRLFCVHK